MAAFQFPDPLVQQTVVNPITGSTYQWKEPPGKWVVSVKLREVNDIVWEGDSPPSAPGYKLWYSTDSLELYFYYCDEFSTCAWVPTSAPITMLGDLEADVKAALSIANTASSAANANLTTIGILDKALAEVENSLGQVTLQEVLSNGNVADKALAIQTANGVSVLEDQALRITHKNNPYVRLVDEADMDSVELSLQSDHAHIDLSSVTDVLHFKFAGEEKVTFRGQGDAEFLGKVKVQPGTESNEVVTYGQLETLEGEVNNIDLQKVLDNGNVATTGATFGDRITIERPELGQATSFAIQGGIRDSNNNVVIGNMLRAYHDSSDVTKDSGIDYKGKIYSDNNLVNKAYVDEQIANISGNVPEEVFDVRCKKDIVCTADSGVSWSTPVSGELRGIYSSGTVKNANRYVGNWNYAVVVHGDDYNIHGDFSSENSNNRGVLEITRHNGSAMIFKGVVKRTYTQGDGIVFLLEHNLFGFGDVLDTNSSSDFVGVGKKCRFYFYTL